MQDSLVPDAPFPARVRARMSLRSGPGVSRPPWDRFNLGDHVGDDPQAVAHARAAWGRMVGGRPVFMRQVHGCDTVWLDADAGGIGCAVGPAAGPFTEAVIVADASLTCHAGVACTVMVADCLPVLLARADGSAVAAAHAGWRGLAGSGGAGILEHTVTALRNGPAAAGAAPSAASVELLAWLGPCIGPEAFEVGEDVRAAFEADDSASAFRPVPGRPGKWWCDLAALARHRLLRLGVRQISGNDGSRPWCTVLNPSRFFSHRRDTRQGGHTGRMAASIWIDA